MVQEQRSLPEAWMRAKSVGLATALALLFGGIGLLYISILIGLPALLVEVVLLVFAASTAGYGGILLVPWHILCAIVAVHLAKKHNHRRLIRMAECGLHTRY